MQTQLKGTHTEIRPWRFAVRGDFCRSHGVFVNFCRRRFFVDGCYVAGFSSWGVLSVPLLD